MRYRNIILLSALIITLSNNCLASINKDLKSPSHEEFTSISTCFKKDRHYFICRYNPNTAARVNTSQCIKISKETYSFMKESTDISKSLQIKVMPGTGSPGGGR